MVRLPAPEYIKSPCQRPVSVGSPRKECAHGERKLSNTKSSAFGKYMAKGINKIKPPIITGLESRKLISKNSLQGNNTNSTRLFCARPSITLLSAMGRDAPKPCAAKRVAKVASNLTNAVRTACALACDKA